MLDASYTSGLTYCYDGATLASAATLSFGARGLRPSPGCSRESEQGVTRSSFVTCDSGAATPTTGTAPLNTTLCRRAGNRVVFTDTNL
jgi:hypothetical protein